MVPKRVPDNLDRLLQSLPNRYRPCPFATAYTIPEFRRYCEGASLSFCPVPIEMDDWYWAFVERVRGAMGRTYLPICRLADGEFRMLFWPVWPNPRHPIRRRAKALMATIWNAVELVLHGFRANTAPDVSSGQFTIWEWPRIRRRSGECFLRIGHEGVLAMHLGVAATPFQEEYFPAVRRWLSRDQFRLTLDNYVPFYFVYALLRGPAGQFLFSGTRVLVVHSATGDRQDRITAAIKARGVSRVEWIHIHPSRSFEDRVDVSAYVGHCDVCFIGAGVGKAIVIDQLRPLRIPVIDAGFVFEAWVDERRAHTRPVMIPDASA